MECACVIPQYQNQSALKVASWAACGCADRLSCRLVIQVIHGFHPAGSWGLVYCGGRGQFATECSLHDKK